MASAEQLREFHLLVARLLVETLAARGISTFVPERLVEDPELRHRDLSLFGLGSLDWIALATQLEDETDSELPDSVLTTPEQRNVAGWGEALLVARTPNFQQTH